MPCPPLWSSALKKLFEILLVLAIPTAVTANISIHIHSDNPGMETPVIQSFSPAAGPVGTLLHISGTGLENPTAITIGGTAALLVSQTGTAVVCMVMPGTISGTVAITTAEGSVGSTDPFSIVNTPYPSVQQGERLFNAGDQASNLGSSVAISADGNTAIASALLYDIPYGGGFVFTRMGSTWNPNGTRLFGSGGSPFSYFQGSDVAISADGNTAILSAAIDNNNTGATWVFVRQQGGSWVQQGPKLVGTGGIGQQSQGSRVALSADGNTLVTGAPGDNSEVGACWVFTRSENTWSQVGEKLVGIGGSTTQSRQGLAVAISADGNTILVNGLADEHGTGPFYFFTRNGNTWTQTDNSMVVTAGLNTVSSVALGADGKTAIVGYTLGNNGQGAWAFSRNGENWTQLGGNLLGTGGEADGEGQGASVSLSADGRRAMVGGPGDQSRNGSAWLFGFDGTNWVQAGEKLNGSPQLEGQYQGKAVALSADGSTAMLGGPAFDANGSKAASVWMFVPAPPPATYTFTGTGHWDNPDNWAGGKIPPATLPKGDTIYINPAVDGECILNVAQIISSGAHFGILPGKMFIITGDLILQDPED